MSEETWRDTILFKRKLHICIYHSKNEKIEEGKVTADWDPSGDKPKLSDNRKKYGEWTGKDRELYNALGMELPVLLEKNESPEIRAGSVCPSCGQGKLEYDGLLNLACVNCGYAVRGCFT